MKKAGTRVLWLFLAALFLMYLVAYSHHPATPGYNAHHPLGWWGWFDQGQYLRAAWSFSQLNLSPQNYFYPPLYPVLGSMFVWLSPLHPFLAVNVICFLLYVFFFLDLARRHVGSAAAIVLFSISFLYPRDIAEVWIEPWTSTAVAPVFAYLFWQIDRLQLIPAAASYRKLALMGLLGGAAFATRPVDAVVMVPIFLFIAMQTFFRCRAHEIQAISSALITRWATLTAAGLIGVVFFCGFNWIVHGSVGGTYFAASTNAAGFHIGDLVEKSVAIFLDPEPLYGSTAEAALKRAPQLALTLPGLIFVALSGPTILRLIILTVITQFAIYLPYADLLPNGFWGYHNMHYFKWMLPYLWLAGVYPFFLFWQNAGRRKSIRRAYLACSVVSVLLLCVRFSLIDVSAQTTTTRLDPLLPTSAIRWQTKTPLEVDMIALRTLQGDFNKVYFGGGNTVRVDGTQLQFIRDFRFFMAPHKTPGLNLLFIRPISAQTIDIHPEELQLLPDPIDVRTFQYGFRLGRPAWLF